MIIGTKAEFENLADYILRDYLGSEYESYRPFDVQAFAKDYLKLNISYYHFNPEARIEGMRVKNQIILDYRLMDDKRIGERNFTIAHECGHDLINWQEETCVPHMITNYRRKRQRKSLVTDEDFKEWQANVVASYLLLRPNLVGWTMFTFTQKSSLQVFGDNYLYKTDRQKLKMMACFLGVSMTCLLYRLNQLGMLEYKPILDYDPAMDFFLSWR